MKDVDDVVGAVNKTLAKISAEGIAVKRMLVDEHMVYRITISKEGREEKIGLPKSLIDDYLDSGDRSIEWMRLIKTAVRKL
jgi:hypothetical protein